MGGPDPHHCPLPRPGTVIDALEWEISGIWCLGSAWVADMAGFEDPAFYGDRWADVYDERHEYLDPAPAVEFLAGLAGEGPVLELAIGTGRVALPLAGRGIAVEGLDVSEAMIARLRA